eukprot:sb/3476385/
METEMNTLFVLTSKQPIRTRYLGHLTGYQPIRDQYFLIWLVPGTYKMLLSVPLLTLLSFFLSLLDLLSVSLRNLTHAGAIIIWVPCSDFTGARYQKSILRPTFFKQDYKITRLKLYL